MMKRILLSAILLILGLFFVIAAIRFTKAGDETPQADENEIKVNIQLDLEEDIGLFLIDYDVDGTQGAGGISNADKSMLQKEQTDLYWSFDKEHFGGSAGTVNLTMDFTIITQYFDPNYDNIYPEAYRVPAGTVSLAARFGEIYYVIITGSKDDGYQATIRKN